jgi:hypothetical protein
MRAGVTNAQAVHFADELRLGLRGPVRRVLAPRGVKVGQALCATPGAICCWRSTRWRARCAGLGWSA